MFLDASAIVAILADEPEAATFIALIESAPNKSTSGIAVFEAVLGLSRIRELDPEEAEALVLAFCDLAAVEIVAIGAAETAAALAAHRKFGKGRGHPARLNLGDCFAYGVASSRGVSLLFKGDDFGATDIAAAAGIRGRDG